MMSGLFHEESPFENKSFFPNPHHVVAFRQLYLIVKPVATRDYNPGPLFYLRSHHVYTHCLLWMKSSAIYQHQPEQPFWPDYRSCSLLLPGLIISGISVPSVDEGVSRTMFTWRIRKFSFLEKGCCAVPSYWVSWRVQGTTSQSRLLQ